MNYIKHLTAYFDRVVNDTSLNPTHISLYVAFFQFWNLNRFQNPISINRDEVMRISKICSKATYHKCIKELHEKGYIIYEPSYNPFKGSLVHMLNLTEQLKPSLKGRKTNSNAEQVNEQALNKSCTSSGTGTEQALVSSINIINNTNSKNNSNLDTAKNKKNNEFKNQTSKTILEPIEEPKKKLREKKGTPIENIIPPDWNLVLELFQEKGFSEIDAQKYFNHYQSNGWQVGGKSKMKNWKAAASNWMLNSQKFNQNKTNLQANQLHISNSKDYAEPL